MNFGRSEEECRCLSVEDHLVSSTELSPTISSAGPVLLR